MAVLVVVVVRAAAEVGDAAAVALGGTLQPPPVVERLEAGDQGREGSPGSKLKVLSRLSGQSRPHLHTPSVCRYWDTSSRLCSCWLLGL